ncbi:MAG: phenylacetate--CoA ligase family protein [bacterium]|nr:phenylacetate--CoA ligase family protein [bacterium]
MMRARIWRNLILPAGDLLARQTVMRHYRSYEESMRWPIERIQAEQDRLVRRVVRTAYEGCPVYRELYDAARVGPADIRGTADLHRLPLVGKDPLRDAYPDRVTLPTGRRRHEYSTSGSTGKPFTVLLDDDTMSRSRALMLLRTRLAGWDFGDPIFQTGMAVSRGALKSLKDRLLRVTYRSAFDLSPPVLDAYLDVIEEQRLPFISGYAQSLYLLAKRARETDRAPRLKGAVTWGSNLLDQFRQEILQAFGCPTFDSYGIGEGIQIAAQSVHSGEYLHQFALHVAAEIVDGEGRPVAPGERGEIVLTRLDAGAMPLVRYRVGDVGRAAAATPETGGINLPLWAGIDGRVSDIIHTPAGNQLIVEFFFGIMQYAPTITDFQVIQKSLDTLHVKIVTGPDHTRADWERVVAEIHDKGDPDLKLEMEIVPDIPLAASGKRLFIVSELD